MDPISEIRFGPFHLLGRSGPLLRDGQEIKLQPKATALLWILAQQPGAVVAKATLMDAVWPGALVGEDALTFQIQALRRAIEDNPARPQYLMTVHRVGFRLQVPQSPELLSSAIPFVGRNTEVASLDAMYRKACLGQRQIVFVTGEAGIGKSTLLEHVAAYKPSSQRRSYFGHCIEQRGGHDGFMPVLEALGRLVRASPDERVVELLQRYAPTWLLQMPGLLDAHEYAKLKKQTAGATQQRMLREMVDTIEQLSAHEPLLLIFEDLHWADNATLDLLSKLAQRREPANLMLICSYRPVDAIIQQHPIRSLHLDLKARGLCSEVVLAPLDTQEVQQYLIQRLGTTVVTQELVAQVSTRSSGHPLFMVHITDDIQEHKDDPQQIQHRLSGALPESLRALIELQFSRLSESEQQILEAGCVAGFEFCVASVSAATGLTLNEVEAACARLARHQHFLQDAGVVAWPDGSVSGAYRFRHALYQQPILERVASSKLVHLHRKIADRLEKAYGTRSPEVAIELAEHFEASSQPLKAALYCMHSAKISLQRFNPTLTLAQSNRGLKLLPVSSNDSNIDALAISLHLLATNALQVLRGYMLPEVSVHLNCIENLLPAIEDPELIESALVVLWAATHFRGELNVALKHAEAIHQLGTLLGKASLICTGLARGSFTLQLMGQFPKADRLSQKALKLTTQKLQSVKDSDNYAACPALGSSAITRWFLGYPDLALARAQQAVACIKKSDNAYVQSTSQIAWLHSVLLYRRDYAALIASCESLIPVCERIGAHSILPSTRIQLAISKCFIYRDEASLYLLSQAMEEQRPISVLYTVFGYAHESQLCVELGRLEEARQAIERGMDFVNQHHMHAWETELLRIDGELLLLEHPKKIALGEARLLEALKMTRARKALSLELRTAMSLARLWKRQKKSAAALELLQPVYARFTEGFDTADLVDAKKLIQSLSKKAPVV